MWMDEKRESFYGAFIQKKHIHMQKKLMLGNWVVFFPFTPSNVDEKQKESSHGLLIQKKISSMHQTLPNTCSQLLHGDFTCQVQQCGQRTQKNHPMGSSISRKAHPYTKTY
jgi:hypothetical protein